MITVHFKIKFVYIHLETETYTHYIRDLGFCYLQHRELYIFKNQVFIFPNIFLNIFVATIIPASL